ncbi:DUF368 domain-containing protein [Nocardioides panacisoli]|uniref:DUF368 domain-containing protein n=1 Tax=Nocardioides panacisoli TaxID=627624 RepID=UPI001C6371B5|nr:DUF368 domain-containing protein [Nocardioides panacisoli]QYJ02905.1 DUF368 domain-containing protein [Nocardioides panacisoli]
MAEPAAAPARSRLLLPLDLLRGFLIGLAELVPGVSGGTVALVTGVYEQLIGSASHALVALKRLALGPDRLAGFRAEVRRTDWWLVVPVLLGMATAVATVAGTMEGFVTDHPEHARGLFFGLVAASVAVPLRMLGGPPATVAEQIREAAVVVGAAVLAYLLIGLAVGGDAGSPPMWVVFLAAAVAICALAVPGVSGSFFLLAVGLYTTTLTAVDERDLGYLAVFAAGALIGLGSFVQLLRYLLERHRRVTLLAMAGLMVGSLRALWPWQSVAEGAAEEAHGPGELLAPYPPTAGPVLLVAIGVAVVVALIVVESRASRRHAER